jgi:hypothetical protein
MSITTTHALPGTAIETAKQSLPSSRLSTGDRTVLPCILQPLLQC